MVEPPELFLDPLKRTNGLFLTIRKGNERGVVCPPQTDRTDRERNFERLFFKTDDLTN